MTSKKFDPANTVRDRATGVYTYTDPETGKTSVVDGPTIVEDENTHTDVDTGLVTNVDPKTGIVTETDPLTGDKTVTDPNNPNTFTPAYLTALAGALQPYLANLAPVRVPRIDTVSPTHGIAGDMVELTGYGFTGGVVSLGDIAVTDLVIVDNRITMKVPPGAVSAPIIVRTKGMLKATSVKFETNYFPPTQAELDAAKVEGVGTLKYASATPLTGPAGTVVAITGEGFSNAKKVSIGDNASGNFNVVDDANIEYTVPVGAKSGTLTVSDGVNPSVGTQWFKVTK